MENNQENLSPIVPSQSSKSFSKKWIISITLISNVVFLVAAGYYLYTKMTNQSKVSDLNPVKNVEHLNPSVVEQTSPSEESKNVTPLVTIDKIQLYPKVSWKEILGYDLYSDGFPISFNNEKYQNGSVYKYGTISLKGRFWSTNYSYDSLESEVVEYYKKNLGQDLFKDSVDVPNKGLTLYTPEYSGDNGFDGYHIYLQVVDNKFRLLSISHLNGQLDLFISDEVDFSALQVEGIQ